MSGPATMMNQCDGCRRKLPLIGGAHRNPDNWLDAIGCTADRYASEAASESAASRSPQSETAPTPEG